MRLLHTADWHLGRVYRGVNLLEDQAELLDQFCTVVREAHPDAVLIAGDVYDRSVPSVDAVRLLDETLTRIVLGERIPVILIAGNHDGPGRLGFGARLLDATGLVVRGQWRAEIEPVVLRDAHGEVAIYPLPYAEPVMLSQGLALDEVVDHHRAMQAQMARLWAAHDMARRAVVLAHAFVQGGTVSESERPLAIGGSEVIGAEVFAGAHYVALGHLHRPQSVSRAALHYAGSLMKYSFNEVDQAKSISLVTLDAQGEVSIERIGLKPRRDLRIIEGTLAALIAGAQHDVGREDYVLARLHDHGALLDALARLRHAYPNALGIERITADAPDGQLAARDHRQQSDMRTLFADFYLAMTGEALRTEEVQMLDQVLNDLLCEEQQSGTAEKTV